MKVLTILLLQLFSVVLFAQKEWTQTTKEGDLKGTLLLPKKKKNIPVVLLIAGSGPTDRDGNQPTGKNNALKYLAEALQKANIATLRVDKRGIAGSAGAAIEEKDLRFTHLVADVKGWVELLAKEKRFNKIIVAGHSQGALVAMLAAIDNDKVAGFVSIAGPGRPIDVVIKEQMERQPEMIQNLVNPILDELKKGNMVEDVPPMLNSLFRTSVQEYMISWMKYDPVVEIKKLKIPVSIIQGTTDLQVKKKDAELLAKAYPKAEKVIIDKMNHVLKEFESMDLVKQMSTYTNPDLPLHKQMSKSLVGFVKALK